MANSKLNEQRQKRIVQAIQLGATYEQAANYAGITYQTLRNWLRRAEDEIKRVEQSNRARIREAERPFIEILEAVKKAEGQAVVGWLAKIERAANGGNWQAAAWKLERRYPEDYGRQVRDVHREGEVETVVKVVKGVSIDDL